MPETTPAGATPAVAGATPAQSAQADSSPADTGTAATQSATDATASTDAEQLGEGGRKALDAERKARTDAERRAKAAEGELEKLRTASLSEDERRTKRLADLEREQADWQRERQELILERSVERQAAKLGFIDPADAMALLDRSALEFDTDGSPRDVDRHLAALAKAKPHLLSQPRSSGSFDAGTGARGGTGTRTYTREQLKDPTFYAANRADIEAALREGRIHTN